MDKYYLYRNQETSLLEVLAANKLLALFNISDDRENGSSFSDYIQDNIKAGLIQSFNVSDKMDSYVYELPALYQEYILQECEKVFNGMGMMLFQALIAIKLYTGKDTPVDYMKEKLGI